jgi:prephenate dehydrogenase
MIGGSLAAALRQADAVGRFTGFDRDRERGARAQTLGIVDDLAVDPSDAVAGADLVILAVPVRANQMVCAAIAETLAPSALVTDVGSTKFEVVAAAEAELPDASRFCGAHPLAGSERSGPDAANRDLFRGRLCILTPTARTAAATLAACQALWQAVGARVICMDAARHDAALAWVSHLPHAVAFALAAAVGAVADEVSGLSGGGFADTTRVAASDVTMWRDVFLANRAGLLAALDGLGDELAALRRAVHDGDAAAIETLIGRANAGRRRVMG